jgi:hypothetical protein
MVACIVDDEQIVQEDPEHVAACETILEQSGGLTLVGAEGSATLCGCIVRRVAVKIPDAGERWQLLAEEIATRFENRGLLGMVIDSTWTTSRTDELAAIGSAYAEALPVCRDELLHEWSGNTGSP